MTTFYGLLMIALSYFECMLQSLLRFDGKIIEIHGF